MPEVELHARGKRHRKHTVLVIQWYMLLCHLFAYRWRAVVSSTLRAFQFSLLRRLCSPDRAANESRLHQQESLHEEPHGSWSSQAPETLSLEDMLAAEVRIHSCRCMQQHLTCRS